MGNENDKGGVGYTVDVADFLATDPELQARPGELAERYITFLKSLSPEERLKEEARAAAEEQAMSRLCEVDEHSHDELVKDAERAVRERHLEIEMNRKLGIIGSMTEVGRAYGLSGVAVGRILDQHSLRERIDVEGDQFLSPLTVALKTFEEEKRERWAAFNAIFRPHHQVEAVEEHEREKLRLLRGLVDGFAIHDHFDARDYWVSVKLAPLLEPHAKRKP